MGFSVSGAFAVLVFASFIAFGMLHSAGANSFERVTDATHDAYEDDLDRQNTAIEIVNVTFQDDQLVVNVTNNGTTALSVNDTDLLVDNAFQRSDSSDVEIQVVGNPDSDLWMPGQTLRYVIQFGGSETPERVKVVTEYGVADAEVVS